MRGAGDELVEACRVEPSAGAGLAWLRRDPVVAGASAAGLVTVGGSDWPACLYCAELSLSNRSIVSMYSVTISSTTCRAGFTAFIRPTTWPTK